MDAEKLLKRIDDIFAEAEANEPNAAAEPEQDGN
jgi:hypothetical protein